MNRATVRAKGPGAKAGGQLDARLQAHIGAQLKTMYDAYLHEPVPDRIVELLQKLDEATREDKGGRDPESGR